MTSATSMDLYATHGGLVLPERPRLLVVDDQPVNIQALNEIFQKDFEVFMTTRGDQVVEAVLEHQPDLILLDVIMPGMDGIDVCRQLKSDRLTRNVPVIFVTSQDSPDEEARGLEVGAVDFISKPISPAVVRARVHTHLLLKAQSDKLKSLAFIDGLTGIANRRQFDDRLKTEWRACTRQASSLALVMFDVDHFKLYNDHYGHQEGDACLRVMADVLHRSLRRPHDLVARYGGEEFVCLLPDCGADNAVTLARSILTAVSAAELPHEASATAKVVTVSAGVAATVPTAELSPEELIVAADHQLYRAKLRGRNTVEVASLDGPESVE